MKYEVNVDVKFLHKGHTEEGAIIDRSVTENGKSVYRIMHRHNAFHNVHLVFEDEILGIVGPELEEELRIKNRRW